MRVVLLVLACFCVFQPAWAAESEPARSRPNILFLLTDNQRWDTLGCAGNPIIRTPNLDRLAAQGVRFRNAFVTTPICAASRASILTGLYRRTHGFTFETQPLRREFTAASYPALLKAAGYRTGLIGKFGIESHGRLLVEDEQRALREMFDHFDNYEWARQSSPEGYYRTLPDGSKKHLTGLTRDKAVRFIRDCTTDRPWCLSVSFNAPHRWADGPRQFAWVEAVDHLYQDVTIPDPVNADPAFWNTQPDFLKTSLNRKWWRQLFDTREKFQSHVKGYYRMISGVDLAVGRIMEELKQQGMDKNTVVLFMSDNGFFMGDRGFSSCWFLHEASLRVPLIVYDPRTPRKLRGRTVRQMALNVDILPTILELAGLPAPRRAQGRSLVPLIAGRNATWRKDFFCEHHYNPGWAAIPKSEGVRTERWKYIRYIEQRPVHEELYDLRSDQHERRNLATEPRNAGTLEELSKRCDALRDLHGRVNNTSQ